MNKYIYLLTILISVNILAEELKYECECKYAEIFVSDPMQNIENTQEDPNCEMLYEGNPENIVFVINLEEKYIYDNEYSELRSKIEKVDDDKYIGYITNDQFRQMFEKETGGESIPNEAMSDFAKGMIDMLGGMLDFTVVEQKSTFELLIDGRIQKEDELSVEMNLAAMLKGLDMPMDGGFANIEKFVTKISSYGMCEEKS